MTVQNKFIIDPTCPFFQFLTKDNGFSQEEVLSILPFFTPQSLRRYQYLFQEGWICSHDYYVLKGSLRKYFVEGEKEITTDLALEGRWISDWESQANSRPSRFNIEALENTQILKIKKKDIDNLVRSNEKFKNLYIHLLQTSVGEQQNRIACMQKPANLCYEQFVSMYQTMELRVSQTHIASFMGISRESLSRLKAQLTKR
jgi:CRP-like cAMP-binding protein